MFRILSSLSINDCSCAYKELNIILYYSKSIFFLRIVFHILHLLHTIKQTNLMYLYYNLINFI